MTVKINMFGPKAALYSDAAEKVSGHRLTSYVAIIDSSAMWDPSTIDNVAAQIPDGFVDQSDMLLILSECFANATLHGKADALILHARRRGGAVLFSFTQIPAMLGRVAVILALAKSGKLPDYEDGSCNGLGLPILVRLSHRVTIGSERNSLRLWMRTVGG